MQTEAERINEIMENYLKGEKTSKELGYCPYEKRIKPVPPDEPSNRYIRITPPDSDLYSLEKRDAIIVLRGEVLPTVRANSNVRHFFNNWDDGTVFSLIHGQQLSKIVSGTIYINTNEREIGLSEIGHEDDTVRVIITCEEVPKADPFALKSYRTAGFVKCQGGWEDAHAEVTPGREEIFSKFGGLIETDVLADKIVFIIGLGSGESLAVLELAKSGVCHFVLMDDDRFEVRNVNRHIAGLSQNGRHKTKIFADIIHEKNPYAIIDTYEEGVSWNNIEKIRKIIKSVDLVHCGTDNRTSKLIVNRLCVEEKTPCIFAGAFRRAYGGQVFFYRGNKNSPCFQCALPFMDGSDKEIANSEQATEMAYTDRPVPIEPGLSTDIAPISLMTVKLSIQELLKDKQTTLRSLDEDLISPWFIWLNRREQGSPYEKLEPLGYNIDGMRILRWYGVDFKKNEGCPVCGNFESIKAEEAGLDLSSVSL